eukprot:7563599-Pyramimonas_sp.AAC.1
MAPRLRELSRYVQDGLRCGHSALPPTVRMARVVLRGMTRGRMIAPCSPSQSSQPADVAAVMSMT